MENLNKQQILEWRKEIEQELVDMLKETDPPSPKATERAGSNFTLEDIKNLIYNEEDNDDFHKLIAMFDRGGDASELSNILEPIFQHICGLNYVLKVFDDVKLTSTLEELNQSVFMSQ